MNEQERSFVQDSRATWIKAIDLSSSIDREFHGMAGYFEVAVKLGYCEVWRFAFRVFFMTRSSSQTTTSHGLVPIQRNPPYFAPE